MNIGSTRVVGNGLGTVLVLLGVKLFLQVLSVNLNLNFLTIDFDVVQELHGIFGLRGPAEINKGVALGSLGDVVARDLDAVNGSDALKIFTNVRFINLFHFSVINQPLDTYLTVSLLLHPDIALHVISQSRNSTLLY